MEDSSGRSSFPYAWRRDGFEDAKIHHYQDSLEMAKAHSDMFLVMLEELAMGIAKSRRQEKGARMQQLIQRRSSDFLSLNRL